MAQRVDLTFLGARSPGRDPRNTAQLARVRIRRVSLGFRPSGPGAADPKRQRKRALFPRAEKGRTNPGRNQKRKARACVCFVGGAGATEPFWVSQMGAGNLRVSSPPSARPNVVGRSSPRPREGHLWFLKWGCNLRVASPWAAPPNGMGRSSAVPERQSLVSRIVGGTPEVASPLAAPPDGMGRSSPRSLVGNLGFHEWGCNHRVASPWAAPPNGMLESPVAGWQSWVSQMGVQPPGREPVGCPSQRDGALEPAVP